MRVEESAREALSLEALALRDAVTDPAARASYDGLATALGTGEVDDGLAPGLERLLELTLRTGRLRRLHGPHAEAAAARLYQATPAGRALGASLAEVNAALAARKGKSLESIAFASKGPGAYALTIGTPAAGLTIEIGGDGVNVKDVSVEG